MVEQNGLGVNIEAEDAKELAETILELYQDAPLRAKISLNARRLAEEKFDRKVGYRQVVEMVGTLLE